MFAQGLSPKSIYRINEVIPIAGSRRTTYRRLRVLERLGLAKTTRGYFKMKTNVISQPVEILQKLLPSLHALKNARRFGRHYNDADKNFAMKSIQSRMITLDYKAWELTQFQYPSDLYLYVENIDEVATYLKENGFSEGQRGHIVLLPITGDFDNSIERVYLDCIANGGRSVLDAIAIELLYGDRLKHKGRFSIQDTQKVQEDLTGRV